jgi:hypothetical protein
MTLMESSWATGKCAALASCCELSQCQRLVADYHQLMTQAEGRGPLMRIELVAVFLTFPS